MILKLMHKKINRNEVLVVLTVVLIIVLFSFLLFKNYQSHNWLRQSSLKIIHQLHHAQVMNITHMFHDRKSDFETLAKSKEIADYFENKNLDMSKKYGLDESLIQIKKKLDRLINERDILGTRIFDRIAFIEETGIMLLEIGIADTKYDSNDDRLLHQTTRPGAELQAFLSDGHINVVIGVPYFFKGIYKGQFFGWLNLKTFIDDLEYHGLLNKTQKSYIQLVSGDESIFFPEPESNFPAELVTTETENPIRQTIRDTKHNEMDVWGLRTQIVGTPFFWVSLDPVREVTGPLNTSFLITLVFALFILAGSIAFGKMQIKAMMMETRLNQEDRQKKEIGIKTIELETEIMVNRSLMQSLKESEGKFRAMSVAAQDALVMVNNDGQISFWNNAATKIFGFSTLEAMGQDYLIMIPDKYHHQYQQAFAEFKVSGKGDVIGKIWGGDAKHKNSKIFAVELSVSAVKIGEKWNVLGIIRDISKRKKDEEELANHRMNLESMVKDRTKDLEQAQKELINKAVDAGRAQLSAMVLHNIGNAITPVAIEAEKLKKNKSDILGRYLKECYNDMSKHKTDLTEYITKDKKGIQIFNYMKSLIGEVDNYHRKLNGMVDSIFTGVEYVSEILSLQRAYAPEKEGMKERISLNNIVRDALKIQKGVIFRRSIKVFRSLSPNLPKVLIEKNKLMQVLVNLIKNSCDAIESNIAKEGKPHRINVSTTHTEGITIIRIEDSGSGIEADRIDDIFKFGISSKGSSGFGLYYCKTFIEANQGSLLLESGGKDQGAVATIRLPGLSVKSKTDSPIHQI